MGYAARLKQFDGLSCRLARNDEDDSARFCRLSNALYARKVDGAYYRWQFFNTPFPSVLSFVTTEDGELAGCYGFHVRRWAATGEQIGMSLDIMVAPRYQGRGVFRALTDFAMERIRSYRPVAVYVMANRRAEEAHVHGLGWKRVNAFADWVCATSGASGVGGQGIEMVPVRNISAEDEEFVEMAGRLRDEQGLFSLARWPGFIEWRFARSPRYSYHIFRCELRGRLLGFLALKTFRDSVTGKAFGDVVDVIWAENDARVLGEMLQSALRYFYVKQVEEAVTCLQTNTVVGGSGRGLGFRRTARQRYVCLKALDERYRWLEDPRRWFVTMADTDLY